jgi:hypothetical protein
MRLIDADKLIKSFSSYLGDDGSYYSQLETSEVIEEINKQPTVAQSKIEVNNTVYVITGYGTSWELIECKVKRTYYSKKFKFSVVGEYKNENIYNGSFAESSIGKTVFLKKSEAEIVLKNKKSEW